MATLATSVSVELGFLTFLKNFAQEVAERAETDEVGKVTWKVVDLGKNGQCIEFTYTPDDEQPIVIQVKLGKRYYAHNMLRVLDTEGNVHPMEADPKVFLAFLTY